MVRAIQFTIRRYLLAVPIIGYFCAFPELAVLLGIFVAALLFVAPVVMLAYLVCRSSLGNGGASNTPPGGASPRARLAPPDP
jgi:hypothetical protein